MAYKRIPRVAKHKMAQAVAYRRLAMRGNIGPAQADFYRGLADRLERESMRIREAAKLRDEREAQRDTRANG